MNAPAMSLIRASFTDDGDPAMLIDPIVFAFNGTRVPPNNPVRK